MMYPMEQSAEAIKINFNIFQSQSDKAALTIPQNHIPTITATKRINRESTCNHRRSIYISIPPAMAPTMPKNTSRRNAASRRCAARHSS